MICIHIILKFSKYFHIYDNNECSQSFHSPNHNLFTNVKEEGLWKEVTCPRSDNPDLVKRLRILTIQERVRTHKYEIHVHHARWKSSLL